MDEEMIQKMINDISCKVVDIEALRIRISELRRIRATCTLKEPPKTRKTRTTVQLSLETLDELDIA